MTVKTLATPSHPHLKQVKFGRRQSVALGPHLKLSHYLRTSLPPAPDTVDYTAKAMAVLSDVMGNDQFGDCIFSGANHIAGVETGNAGNLFHATLEQVLADYSAVTGFVESDPSTDNGGDLQAALNYYTQHGFADGTRLLGWLAVDPTNNGEVMSAMYLFENLYFGIGLPDAWVTPFPSGDGFLWDVAGAADHSNGHCFMGAGFDSVGVKIDSWGMLGTLTWAAIAKYGADTSGGELYVMLTPDQLAKGATKAPNGVAWADLIGDFDAIGGHVPLPPAPVPSPLPIPTPGHTTIPAVAPTKAQVYAWACQHLSNLMWKTTAEQAIQRGLEENWPAGVP